MIDVEGLLTESIALELNGLKTEDDIHSVLEMISVIQESGIYVFMTNGMAETYASFIANNLAVRRFILGLSERFQLKLAMQAPDITKAQSFVDSTLTSLTEIVTSARGQISNQSSLAIENVQSELTLESIVSVLEGNVPFLILYLCEVTGAFRAALSQFNEGSK